MSDWKAYTTPESPEVILWGKIMARMYAEQKKEELTEVIKSLQFVRKYTGWRKEKIEGVVNTIVDAPRPNPYDFEARRLPYRGKKSLLYPLKNLYLIA